MAEPYVGRLVAVSVRIESSYRVRSVEIEAELEVEGVEILPPSLVAEEVTV